MAHSTFPTAIRHVIVGRVSTTRLQATDSSYSEHGSNGDETGVLLTILGGNVENTPGYG